MSEQITHSTDLTVNDEENSIIDIAMVANAEEVLSRMPGLLTNSLH